MKYLLKGTLIAATIIVVMGLGLEGSLIAATIVALIMFIMFGDRINE